jgi:protein-disulfide isomerase
LRRAKRLCAALALLALALVAGGCGGSGGGSSAEAGRLDLAGVPQSGTSLGGRNARGTLVEFTDLRCARCRDFNVAVLPALVKRYVKTGKLRLEQRTIAFGGPASLDAAAWAAAAARQNRLYEFADAYFRGQDDPETAAQKAGLDVTAARRYAAAGPVRRALARTSAQAREAGIVAPGFFVSRSGGEQQPFPAKSMTPAAFTGALDRLLRS